MTKYVKTQVKKVETPASFWACLFVLGILASLYIYLISGAVTNTLEYKNLSIKTETVASRIVDKEIMYTDKVLKIDRSFAIERGFNEVASGDTYYVPMSPGVAVVFSN